MTGTPDPAFARLEARHGPLTNVHLTWIEKKREHWLRFGRVAHVTIVSRSQSIHHLRTGSIFALIRWDANDYGTIASHIDILRCVAAGEPFTSCPDVTPGGQSLLSLSSWPRVSAVLRAIDAVDAAGVDPCDAAPEHWMHVAQRIGAGLAPRVYTPERHKAWLKRRRIET